MKEEVQSLLKVSTFDYILIPGGHKYVYKCTIILINPFEGLITERYYEWFANRVQNYTEQKNLKSPPRNLIVQYKELSDDIANRSFKGHALRLRS